MSDLLQKTRFNALVMDDDEQFRRVMVRALEGEGFSCHEAPNPTVAENLLRRHEFDLVTADLIMPKQHGHKLVRELLDREPRPVVVVSTGVRDMRILRDLIARGVDDIFIKPFDLLVFTARALVLLERRWSQVPVSAEASGDMSEKIEKTTAVLQSQLETIQSSFRSSIEALERQKEDLELGLVGSVRFLTNMIHHVGRFEESHVVRVERLATAIGTEIGLSKSELKDLKVAALLHNIGQIGMPERIRERPPWNLTPEDRKIFETYPTVGALILSEIHGIEGVIDIVEHHTEHFDGSGFPAGLRGEAIPLGARLLSVAEGYETNVRFDRQAGAIEELARQKGKRHDPAIANVAINHLRSARAEAPAQRPVETVRVSDLRESQVLADAIMDDRGIMLVGAGKVLTRHVLEKVKHLVPDQMVNIFKESEEAEEATEDVISDG